MHWRGATTQWGLTSERRDEMTKKKPLTRRPCEECGREYTVRRHWQKFCTPTCRFLHFFKLRAEAMRGEEQ